MKTVKLVVAIAVLLTGINLQAQQKMAGMQKRMNHQGYEKIMQKKMLFMKENLMLTPQEAKAFEAEYKTYAKEKMQLHQALQKEFRQKIENGKYLEMSDRELNLILDKKLELENKKMQLELNFQKRLRRILPPKKMIKFYKSERGFNRKMMSRMKKGRKMQKRNKKQLPKNK